MKRIIHVRIFRGEKYFVAECFDLPVVTQGATLDELIKNVKEAIALQLEGENPADFGLAPDASILASYDLEPEPKAHAETYGSVRRGVVRILASFAFDAPSQLRTHITHSQTLLS